MNVGEQGQPGRIAHLPWSQVWRISWRNIQHRMARCMLAMGGIILSIAFLVHVLSSASLERAAGGEGITARQQWLICVSLLVCAVGIANAMLMNVMERYREIGTIKCLGALDSLIVKLFLIEAGIMGVLGALLGALLGWMLAVITALTTGVGAGQKVVWPWGELLGYGVLATLVGLVITMSAAIYPSWRAARMEPAEAMRTEV